MSRYGEAEIRIGKLLVKRVLNIGPDLEGTLGLALRNKCSLQAIRDQIIQLFERAKTLPVDHVRCQSVFWTHKLAGEIAIVAHKRSQLI